MVIASEAREQQNDLGGSAEPRGRKLAPISLSVLDIATLVGVYIALPDRRLLAVVLAVLVAIPFIVLRKRWAERPDWRWILTFILTGFVVGSGAVLIATDMHPARTITPKVTVGTTVGLTAGPPARPGVISPSRNPMVR